MLLQMALFCSFYGWVAFHLEKAMAPHSSTLAWKIPWMEEPGRLQIHGVAKSRTWLKWLSSSSSSSRILLRVCVYTFFIHSSVDGRFGCFRVLVFVNSTAVNIEVPAPFQIMVFCKAYIFKHPWRYMKQILWALWMMITLLPRSSYFLFPSYISFILVLTQHVAFHSFGCVRIPCGALPSSPKGFWGIPSQPFRFPP